MPRASEPPPGGTAIRDAATIILLRRSGAAVRILMGLRGAGAVFMPDRFVFPGGAVDPEDAALEASLADTGSQARIGIAADPAIARALPLAAIRELWEETGLRLGRADPKAATLARTAPAPWRGFFAGGVAPNPDALRFVFRAVTPSGRPRRFDARFFVAEAADLAGDPDDFAQASGELTHLSWVGLPEARALRLAFITEVVLAEIEALLGDPAADRPVPFFQHTEGGSHFRFL